MAAYHFNSDFPKLLVMGSEVRWHKDLSQVLIYLKSNLKSGLYDSIAYLRFVVLIGSAANIGNLTLEPGFFKNSISVGVNVLPRIECLCGYQLIEYSTLRRPE